MQDIQAAQLSARGHSDYGAQFAYRVADAMRREKRTR